MKRNDEKNTSYSTRSYFCNIASSYVMINIVEFNLLLQVRIFTFSVGQHNYDKGPIQWMACSNKGTAQLIIHISTVLLSVRYKL